MPQPRQARKRGDLQGVALIPRSKRSNSVLWLTSVALYGAGDVITTYYGISYAGRSEQNTIPSMILSHYGWIALLLLKVLFILGAFLVWRQINRRVRVGIPIGLSLVGAIVIAVNVAVIIR